MMIGLLTLGLGLSFSAVSFADKAHDDAAFVKLLQDSAAALKVSKPALAADLTLFANEEANEIKEGKEEPKENTPAKMASRAAHVKLLKDSAAALQTSHPDLAAALAKAASRKPKKAE
jgi:hypothetical protein